MTTKTRNPRWRVVKDDNGMGGFLCPPGHWNHHYVIEKYHGPTYGYETETGLDGAEDNPRLPESVKAEVRQIKANTTLVCSEAWVRMVYGYFRNCYLPESGDKRADQLLIPKAGEPVPPPERHRSPDLVREFFPDHDIRLDLIADPGKGYGSWPCGKCGQRVQYEPRLDTLAVVQSSNMRVTGWDPVCPAGGDHSVPEDTATLLRRVQAGGK